MYNMCILHVYFCMLHYIVSISTMSVCVTCSNERGWHQLCTGRRQSIVSRSSMLVGSSRLVFCSHNKTLTNFGTPQLPWTNTFSSSSVLKLDSGVLIFLYGKVKLSFCASPYAHLITFLMTFLFLFGFHMWYSQWGTCDYNVSSFWIMSCIQLLLFVPLICWFYINKQFPCEYIYHTYCLAKLLARMWDHRKHIWQGQSIKYCVCVNSNKTASCRLLKMCTESLFKKGYHVFTGPKACHDGFCC